MKKIFFLMLLMILAFNACSQGVDYLSDDFWKTATLAQVKSALKWRILNVNAQDINGITVLMYAVDNNTDVEIIKTLLAAGAKIDAKSNSGLTAFVYAAENPNLEVLKIFLDAGFDAKYQGGYLVTALMWAAARNSNPAVVNELIKAGADVNAADQSGKSVLMNAARNQNIEIVKMILAAGANIMHRSNDGNSVLYDASANKNPEVIKMLLDAGAKVNLKNKDGATPLMYFLGNSESDCDILMRLTKETEDINAQDIYGYTALIYAAQSSRCSNAVVALINAGADLTAIDQDGKTAWDYIEKNDALINTEAYRALDKARKK